MRLKRHTGPRVASKEEKSARKKRVIVYKNGNPTSGTVLAERRDTGVKKAQEPSTDAKPVAASAPVNITSNPLDEALQKRYRSPEETSSSHERRYSMQERVSRPPNLMRNFSEIHPCGAPPSDQRKNRHSWSSPPLAELNVDRHSLEQIRIDIDQAEC